ncbi:AmmeMemoRadiSam system protein B [Phocaeicola oris]|uniref:AmmeMemoRadiSam system protein B n=1 Tax=Phocaeicola oris TaxID=2896850 RepID=UPI00234E4297|nr:AmmeMemoRadiSam system protein B [Phocaeicola oris]MCE2617138.1 AmmeMemoRadiSam system protein B [Phocaeicola oris]
MNKLIAILIFLTMLGLNKMSSQSNIRPMAVAGSFYPTSKKNVEATLSEYLNHYKNTKTREDITAIIVPHAGWIYSGAVAAAAVAQINPKHVYEHIFLIGPSHQIYFNGASVNTVNDYYATPLGNIKVAKDICSAIAKHALFTYKFQAHAKEHCIEVQLPLLQYHLKKMPDIIPIIISTQNDNRICQIAEVLKPYFNKKNLFVISSDFSHYPCYEDANKVDKRTEEAILSGDINKFYQAIQTNEQGNYQNLVTSACGQCAIATLLYMMKDRPMNIHHLLYKNSGDVAYAEKDRVVGYHAFIITDTTTQLFSLNNEERQTLLKIARQSIKNKLNQSAEKPYKETDITPALKEKCGAFVSLYIENQLRGCIGHFGSNTPLYGVVEEMAQEAAFEDPRFNEVTINELSEINIEISVLTPLKKIHSVEEFQYGKQGIYIKKGFRSGTFLPQVANEVNWTKEEFLGHCARDKAGIGWDEWKDADLYTYEAIIFKENKK